MYKKSSPVIIAFILCMMLNSFSSVAQPGEKNIADKIDSYMQAHTNNKDFSGVILLATKDSVLFQKAYGYSDTEDKSLNDVYSLFRISSLTKTFTAALIIKFKEQGLLKFDDLVSKYIAGYPNGEKITIGHLLNHRSGIPDYADFPDFKERMKSKMSLAELVDWFKNKPLLFAPGASNSYSNSGYSLLALVAEKIQGRAFEEILKEQMLDPLSLRSTGMDSYDKYYTSGHVRGYKLKGNHDLVNVEPYYIENLAGSGCLYSNVSDLHKWVRSVFTSKVYNAQKNPAYGWGVRKYFNRDLLEQSGRTDGFLSCISYYYNEGLAIIYLGNIESFVFNQLKKDLAAIYFNEPYSLPRYRKELKFKKKNTLKWIGTFRDSATNFTITANGNHLLFSYNNSKTLHDLIPLSNDQLFLRLYGVTLKFVNSNEIEWIEEGNRKIYRTATAEIIANK